MGGGDLNTKKSWHPSTMKNQERVWKAEQVAANEKRRIEDLKREIDLEKSKEDLMMLGQSSGILKEKGDKLDWMYKGPGETVDREEYLLGKTVDKNYEQQQKQQQSSSSQVSKKNHVEHECIPFSIRNFRGDNLSAKEVQVDMARKVMEDPLVAIKKRELESRAELLQNPVKLKELTRLLREDKEIKKQKKEKDKKKKKNSDLDYKLAEKLKLLKSKDHFDIDSLLLSKRKISKSHSKMNVNTKNSSDSSDESEPDKTRPKKRKIHKAVSKKKNRKRHSSESSDESESDDEEKNQKKRNTHKTVLKVKERRKHNSERSNKSKPEKDANSHKKRNKTKYVLKAKVRAKNSSESSDESESEDEVKSHRKRKKAKEFSKTSKRVKQSTDSSDESKSESKPKIYERQKHNADHRNNVDCNTSSNRYTKVDEYHNRNSKHKYFEHKMNYSDDSRKIAYEKSYKQSEHEGRDRLLDSRDKWHESRHKTEGLNIKRDEEKNWKKNDSKELSNAEREEKLREMMENASKRDREREKNIAHYREQERKQASRNKVEEFDKSFVEKQLWKSAQVGSVESRIKANINNIQRSKRDMDSHFAKR